MSDQIYHKKMFTVAVIWNFTAAIIYFLVTISHKLLGLFSNIIPEGFLWYNLFLGIILVFGLGYYWIGQDVSKNRNIIKMGILGKTLVFILLTSGWLNVVATILTAGAGAADLVFISTHCSFFAV